MKTSLIPFSDVPSRTASKSKTAGVPDPNEFLLLQLDAPLPVEDTAPLR